jgi:hypothetical protein
MAQAKAPRPPKKKVASSGKKGAKKAAKSRPPLKPNKDGVVLLSGGNPQIAKGDGDAPVQAYLAALPGWKSALGKRLDALIVRSVPKVQKCVKWNSPFYGIEGQGWFLGMHAFNKYLKLSFLRGSALKPLPPGPSKDKDARYLDIREDDELDEAQLVKWLKQAAAIPGWIP